MGTTFSKFLVGAGLATLALSGRDGGPVAAAAELTAALAVMADQAL